jgi:hypothetical protein
LVRRRNKLAIIRGASPDPVARVEDAVVGAARVEVRVLIWDEVGMFSTKAVDKGYFPKKKIVLPATREKTDTEVCRAKLRGTTSGGGNRGALVSRLVGR